MLTLIGALISSVAFAQDTQITVPATGEQAWVYPAPDFGRFSFQVKSPSGASLQLIDKMTGPGTVSGRVGEEDGRVDAFLDQGEVKVLIHSDARGEGQATITATPFQRLDGLQVLQTGRPHRSDLEDLQERAFWVEAVDNEVVAFEAVGRFVEDMRLWRDGSWLVDSQPVCQVISPVDGQPMKRCQLTAKVEAGQYQVAVYGGQGQPWSQPGDDTALYLLRGLPQVSGMGRVRGVIGPTGTHRQWVPQGVGYAHLALDDNAHVTLRGGSYQPTRPFATMGSSGAITDESRIPVADVWMSAGDEGGVISVEGPPGTPYILTWFEPMSGRQTIQGDGPTFVGTLQAVHPADIPDPTGVLYRHTPDERDVLVRSLGIQVDSQHAYTKRFGIDGAVQIMLNVSADTRFKISSDLAMGGRIEPLWTTRPKGYESPPSRTLPLDETLDAGQYLLTIKPETPGIATLSIQPNGWGDMIKQNLGFGANTGGRAPGLMTVVDADDGPPMTLWPAAIPGVTSGLVVRDLPLTNLDEALPLAMMPGETISLPIHPGRAGVLQALTIDGAALSIAVDGLPASGAADLSAGPHTVVVRNDTDAPVRAMLQYRSESPPPALTRAPSLSLPDFDALSQEEPAFLDLDRDSQHTFLVQVAESGLYRVASTGLLATQGNLRGRVRLSLGAGDQNGVGRNFNIARYLRTADYQLTVRTQNRSAGHLGLTLVRADVADGGDLRDDVPARVTVPAGDAVRYTFTVADEGRYRIASRSQSGVFQCRVEDEDGWPRTAPSVPCDLNERLQPGTYGLLVLPEQVQTRRITTVTRRVDEEMLDGHGPHPLQLGKTSRHLWVEPTDGAERVPDVWTFRLPATAKVSISAGDEMAGNIVLDGETVGRLVPGRTWTESLEPGDYQVEIMGARKGTGIPYGVRVRTSELVVGVSRTLSVPTTEWLSVGAGGLVTLASRGATDVRAQLLDSAGNVVASNDDRPDDWNFRLSTWLDPGRYKLVLEAVAGGGQTTVDVQTADEYVVEALKPGKSRTLEIQGGTVVLPLVLSKKHGVVQARAQATETIGLAIEVQDAEGRWRSLARAAGRTPRVAARPAPGSPTRLRLWSLDDRGGPVQVTATDAAPRSVSGNALVDGMKFRANTPWPAVFIGGKTGLFALEGARIDIWACPRVGQGCVPAPPVVPITEDGLVILGETLKGHPLSLEEQAVIALDQRPVSVDVPDADLAVLIARTSTGQPAAQFEGGLTALGDRAALAIDLAGVGRATVWRGADMTTPVQTRLVAHKLTASKSTLASAGQTTVTLPANGAVLVPLGKKQLTLRLGLERGTAAVVSEQVIWADEHAATTELVGKGTIWLLNPTDVPRMVTVESRLTQTAQVALTVARSWEQVLPTAGLQTFAVAPDPGGRLHIRGAELRYLREDGAVLVGTDLEVGEGGTAWLTHDPGTVMAWVERFDSPGPWRETKSKAVTLAAGAERALTGEAIGIDIDLGAPGVAHLRVSSPFVVWVGRTDVPQVVHVEEDGGLLDLWLPTGTAHLVLRGIGDSGLSGSVSLTASNAAEIGEGLGPEVLLLPGSSRWFRFTVTEEGPVGVGVAAEADRVLATVYSEVGGVVGSGLVRRVELTPGTWLLALSQPADGAPIRARPALAGIERPDSGPPEDIVRGFLLLAERNPEGGDQ